MESKPSNPNIENSAEEIEDPIGTLVPRVLRPPVLGLDLGDRRIGVAVSDGLGVTAQPVLTLERKNLRLDLRFLSRLVRKYGCGEIVVGNPLYMSGDPSPQAGKAGAFAGKLREATGLEVHLWDERLSTGEAHRYLDAVERDPRSRRAVIDQLAAVLILQAYLDARNARAGQSIEPR